MKRATTAIIGLLLLAGCSADVKIPEQPSMYLDMAQPGATLDTVAAAIMISQYRQNNGLGTVVVDPELTRLAEQQSQAMAARNKMDHNVKGPLDKRLGLPAIRRRLLSKTSRPAITLWRRPSPAGATRRRTRRTCSKTVSQNWASRRLMLQTPNTRCSGRLSLHQPEAGPVAGFDASQGSKLGVILASFSPIDAVANCRHGADLFAH